MDEIGLRNIASQDLEKCKNWLTSPDKSNDLPNTIINKYRPYMEDFCRGFDSYDPNLSDEQNKTNNMQRVISALEMVKEVGVPETSKAIPSINVSNISNINAQISLELSIVQSIMKEPDLNDKEKVQLCNDINEIQNSISNGDSKKDIWNKTSKVMSFILDKGADLAICYLPQIINLIQSSFR